MKRIIGLALCVLSGCGVYVCAMQNDCAQKAGDPFSITACRNDALINREKAASKNCAAPYHEYEVCFASLTCDQLNLLGIANNCGGKYEQYLKCMN